MIVEIGTSNGEPFLLDVDKLVSTRLLIQSNSGGGKSYAIRKIVEESAGSAQIILIDLEGEFASLRERHDFVLFGKKDDGADVQIGIKFARTLPQRLMELRVSAILDLSELKKHERILFVKRFLDGMISLPKKLWHPVMIILDEAHQFCPQKEKCESTGSVIDLMSRGRKRGQCGWLATQRISKLNKDAAAECNNKLIGRCVLDVDMKRAGEEIGFTNKKDVLDLRFLSPGEFWGFGPAFPVGIRKVTIGNVHTTHPKVGTHAHHVAPAAPSKIRAVLGSLEGLEAEEAEKEKVLADYKAETASLRGKVLSLEQQLRKAEEKGVVSKKEVRVVPTVEYRIPPAVRKKARISAQTLRHISDWLGGALSDDGQREALKDLKGTTAVKVIGSVVPTLNGNGVPAGARRMLSAAAALGKVVSRSQVATVAGMSARSGTFSNYLGLLRLKGWLSVQGDRVEITPEGLENVGGVERVSTRAEDILAFWLPKFPDGCRRMLQFIFDSFPSSVLRQSLADAVGMQAGSGTFSNYLGLLKRNGLVVVQGQEVCASKELFPEGKR